jgi:8-oxo-dGTP pyrophosphatase MutT (NUDIX family)
MRLLTHNYTVGSLASALRDREDALQQASVLAADGKIEELQDFLSIFHPALVLERRVRSPPSSSSSMLESTAPHPVHQPTTSVDITQHLDDRALERLRRSLMRMPRNVISAHAKRAAVVLALCTIDNVPCLLMEKRAENLRSHAAEVCLPGGMVCEISDSSIVDTCLREMKEEIGGLQDIPINVLGVFRCNWGDVHHLVGVAVTPVVCFLGELPERLYPNPDEVSQVFTISLASLLEKDLWVHKDGLAPIFVGGPYPIWGLTGYILDKFAKEILRPNQHTTIAKQRTLYKNNALDS